MENSDVFRMNKAIVSMFIKTASMKDVRDKKIMEECNKGVPLRTIMMMLLVNPNFSDEEIIKMIRYWTICSNERDENKECVKMFKFEKD